jgi:hypothetical protein
MPKTNLVVRVAQSTLGLFTVALLFFFAACGGSGNHVTTNDGSQSSAPTNLLYSQATIVATVGQAITADKPTVTGTVASYSISPSLPAGLHLDGATGVLSGTPTAAQATKTYTVTAANSSGSTVANLHIGVEIAAPKNLVYQQASITAFVGQAIVPDVPTITGTVTSYKLSLALPPGLTMDTTTGVISGIPTAAAATASYGVTAFNPSGTAVTHVQITVVVPPPSHLVYPQSTIALTVGQTLAPVVPSVTGTVTSYSISPALPVFFGFDATTGAISAKPIDALPPTTYTVTAANVTGSTTTQIQITVTGTVPAPTNLSYQPAVILMTIGQFLFEGPTVTGPASSYTITPDLPPGLTMDVLGFIRGTPTSFSPATLYTVTATNSAGSTTTTIQIAVNAAGAQTNLVYPQQTITAVAGQTIVPDIPAVTGAVSSYSVTPALPAGLTLDPTTGTISGTPTAATPLATYAVMAANSPGSSVGVTISVSKALTTLLDLAAGGGQLRFQGSRVLSQGPRWVLWDYDSGAELASGEQGTSNGPLDVDMAGQIVVIAVQNGLEVHSSFDGHLLSIISFGVTSGSASTWWKLASDGSYICAGSKAGLFVWTPDGRNIISRAGDYSAAKAFAAAGEVRVALGPAGKNVVETITTPSGASTVSAPFSGNFNSWFADGERFFSNLANTVWINSKTAVQQGILSMPTISNLGGEGTWFWSYEPTQFPSASLPIYSVGSTSPVITFSVDPLSKLVVSGSTIGVLPSGPAVVSIIDLSGPTPVRTDHSVPVPFVATYAAISSSKWIAANQHEVIFDGTSLPSARYFGLGEAWSIAGSSSRAAISTASGSIFYFNPASTTPEGTINFSAGKVQLSSDGSVLAAAGNTSDFQFAPDSTLNIFSLPSGALSFSFPYTFPGLTDFTLSASGTALGRVLPVSGSGSHTREVTPLTGSPVTWSDSVGNFPLNTIHIHLSPNGTLVAVSADGNPPGPDSITNIYKDGVLTGTVPGFAVGWIDDGRLLVNNYVVVRPSGQTFTGCTIYDGSGVKVATAALPELRDFQTVTPDLIYSAGNNAIYSVTTGKAVWTGPFSVGGLGAVAGPNVVFEHHGQVFVTTY